MSERTKEICITKQKQAKTKEQTQLSNRSRSSNQSIDRLIDYHFGKLTKYKAWTQKYLFCCYFLSLSFYYLTKEKIS